MDKLPEYSDLLDMAFKLVGIFIALYIAPIKKSMDSMSQEMKGMQRSIEKLNTNVAVMFEKHDKNELRLEKLEDESSRTRDKMHDLINNHIVKIELNSVEISVLKDFIKKVN